MQCLLAAILNISSHQWIIISKYILLERYQTTIIRLLISFEVETKDTAFMMELTLKKKNQVRSDGNVWNVSNDRKNSTFWVLYNKLMVKYIFYNYLTNISSCKPEALGLSCIDLLCAKPLC